MGSDKGTANIERVIFVKEGRRMCKDFCWHEVLEQIVDLGNGKGGLQKEDQESACIQLKHVTVAEASGQGSRRWLYVFGDCKVSI